MIGDEKSLKFWRRVVTILGVLLLAAMLFTVVAVIQGLGKKSPSLKLSSVSSDCAGGEMRLKNAGNFKNVIFHDDKILLTFDGHANGNKSEENGDKEIMILDYCNNKIISKIIIED